MASRAAARAAGARGRAADEPRTRARPWLRPRHHAVYLAQQGFSVVAVDFVPAALAAARTRAEQGGVKVELRECDVVEYEAPSAFDVVLDSGCLHHLPKGKVGAYSRRRYDGQTGGSCRACHARIVGHDSGEIPAELLNCREVDRVKRTDVRGKHGPGLLQDPIAYTDQFQTGQHLLPTADCSRPEGKHYSRHLGCSQSTADEGRPAPQIMPERR